MDGGPLLPREPDASISGLDCFDRARGSTTSESASERSIAASLDFSATSRSIRSCSVWLNRILPSWTPKTSATECPSWMKPRFSNRSTTASTSSRPPVAPASIRPRAAWTRSRSASRTAAVRQRQAHPPQARRTAAQRDRPSRDERRSAEDRQGHADLRAEDRFLLRDVRQVG